MSVTTLDSRRAARRAAVIARQRAAARRAEHRYSMVWRLRRAC
ncbi:hypothetical protein [Nocardioides sp.]